MQLHSILSQERCAINVSIQSQKRLFEYIADLFATDLPSIRADEVFEVLSAREKLGSTALGSGLALPHARLEVLEFPLAACIRLQEGLEFCSPDGSKVDLFFILLAPAAATQQHLDILATVANLLNQPTIQTNLRTATTCQQFYRTIVPEE